MNHHPENVAKWYDLAADLTRDELLRMRRAISRGIRADWRAGLSGAEIDAILLAAARGLICDRLHAALAGGRNGDEVLQ